MHLVLASINCGETDTLVDTNGIIWTPDTNLISNGVARVVQSSNQITPIVDTLRVFTSRRKNCYSVPVTKGEKVLVRVLFNYGNYDRLSNPPTFDIHFDGNYWTTVQTALTGLTMHEVTYVTKGDAVSVCLAQTKSGQFPIISTLEVRGLDSEIYSDLEDSRALFLMSRFSYGASGTLRYPSDPYDRIWLARTAGTETATSDAIVIDSTGPNAVPSGVLRNAATVGSTTDRLLVATISPISFPVYMNMYFSEVSNLDSTETRSFKAYETNSSGTSPFSPTISPPYGSLLESTIYDYSVDSMTNISLVADADSDYPPLVNAIEAFYISGVLTEGTDSNDVEALGLLQTTFDVLGEWKGDPCLPAGYSWDWLNCSNDAIPRVTSLHLDSFGLSGSLPDISSMDALEIIDFHNNSFTGTIPSSLGTMPNLKELNLGNNKLSGSVPSSLSKNNKLKLIITGNPLCTASSKACSNSPATINSSPDNTAVASKKKSNMLPVVLGVTIPAFFLMWIAAGNGAYGGQTNAKFDGFQTTTTSGEHVDVTVNNEGNQTFGSPSPLLDENYNHNNSDDATH
uniref:putative leucine-rich repeat receptor-like serine/threonine-protein kinase At2g19230 n=1 Tax=Erigeron canadensis TaxID=72917 RepID=UPI001CB8FC13|nr:putative leucine-rich repeat receptor-like serine/threonine-protein kinase At2g19230 [Erigeron canadensis]